MKYIKKIIYRIPPLHILIVFYRDILVGYKRYATIKRKYEGANIYTQYYAGTGDVYLSTSYLKYCLENRLQESKQNVVYIVNGKSAYKVAQLFQLNNIVILEYKEKDSFSLVDLVRFMGNALIDITFLHYMSDCPMYTCFWIHLAGIHGLNFWDLYQIGVFHDKKIFLSSPDWQQDDFWVNQVFQKNYLEIGKTILLAPDANSIAIGPKKEFWIMLTNKLKAEGYQICTNLSTPDSIPIEGTQGVFIPYEMLDVFLRRCRSFIGYRSGLCDLIATISCKKVIVYPASYWPIYQGLNIGKTLDVFSLKNIEENQNLLEVEYQKNRGQEIVGEIVAFLASN